MTNNKNMIKMQYQYVSNVIKIYFTPKNYLTFLKYLYNQEPLDTSTKLMLNAMLNFDTGLFTSTSDLYFAIISNKMLGGMNKTDVEFAVWTTDYKNAFKYINTSINSPYRYIYSESNKKAVDPKKIIDAAQTIFENNQLIQDISVYDLIGDNNLRVAPFSYIGKGTLVHYKQGIVI